MINPALDVLLSAHFVLSNPNNWCQHALARYDDGRVAHPCDRGVAQWCLVGAMIESTPIGSEGYDAALDAFRDCVLMMAELYNDKHSHAEVIEALEATINREMSENYNHVPPKRGFTV